MSVYITRNGRRWHPACHWREWCWVDTRATLGVESVQDGEGVEGTCAGCGEPVDLTTLPFSVRLARTRVLWRSPEPYGLYGLPYAMRPGQAPRDIVRARQTQNGNSRIYSVYDLPRPEYIPPIPLEWLLITPGFLPDEDRALAAAFIEHHRQADNLPLNPWEWTVTDAPRNPWEEEEEA